MSRHHTHLNARRGAAVRQAAFERDGWRWRQCGWAKLDVGLDEVQPSGVGRLIW